MKTQTPPEFSPINSLLLISVQSYVYWPCRIMEGSQTGKKEVGILSLLRSGIREVTVTVTRDDSLSFFLSLLPLCLLLSLVLRSPSLSLLPLSISPLPLSSLSASLSASLSSSPLLSLFLSPPSLSLWCVPASLTGHCKSTGWPLKKGSIGDTKTAEKHDKLLPSSVFVSLHGWRNIGLYSVLGYCRKETVQQ